MPASDTPAAAPGKFRSPRAQQLAQARQRHMALAEQFPDLEPAQLAAMTDDRFWGPDELWRHALDPHPSTAAPPANGQKSRWAWSRKTKTTTGEASPAAPTDTPGQIVTLTKPSGGPATLTVPKPGAASSIVAGRIRSWVIRLAVLTAPLAMVGGLAYACGSAVTASSAASGRKDLIAEQAGTWHLSTFPVQQAASFGATYLTLCMTHPVPADSAALTGRSQALAAMTSAGVSDGCGWDGSGGAQSPLSVSWTGTATPVAGAYDTGEAARLTYVVTFADGRTNQVSLPVWAASATGANGMRVVGEITVLPYAGAAPSAPTAQAPETVDDNLAIALQPTVLTPFLQAWGASNSVQLSLTVTSDAAAAATTGMSGTLTDPSIDSVLLVVDKGSPKAYRDGDLVTAQTVVEWRTTAAGVQKSAYDISLRRVGGRWLVVDIAGGPIDQQGGAAAQTFSTPTSSPDPTSS